MLAAAALSAYADDVTVVERDALPAGPEPRKGLPQARHVHVAVVGRCPRDGGPAARCHRRLAGGGRAPDPAADGSGLHAAQGWFRRWPEMQFMIACSRDLLDWVVRDGSRAAPASPCCRAPNCSASRATPARDRCAGASRGRERIVLDADLVVDATGRGSRAHQLARRAGRRRRRGEGRLRSRVRQPDLPGAGGHRGVPRRECAAGRAGAACPAQTTTIVPIEGGRWLVTLSGTRGGQPTDSAAEFEDFARGVRHPIVAELIAHAEPLSDVVRHPQHRQPAALLREGRGLARGLRRDRRLGRHVQPGLRARALGGRAGRRGAAGHVSEYGIDHARARPAGAARCGAAGRHRLGPGHGHRHPLPRRDRRAAGPHGQAPGPLRGPPHADRDRPPAGHPGVLRRGDAVQAPHGAVSPRSSSRCSGAPDAPLADPPLSDKEREAVGPRRTGAVGGGARA